MTPYWKFKTRTKAAPVAVRFMPLRKDVGRFRLEKEIPAGSYCYEAVLTGNPVRRGIRVCPYYAGQRPMDCQCLLYRGAQDGWFNLDAIKGCGINEYPDDYLEEGVDV